MQRTVQYTPINCKTFIKNNGECSGDVIRNLHLEKNQIIYCNIEFCVGNYKKLKYDIKSLSKSLRLRFCILRFLTSLSDTRIYK